MTPLALHAIPYLFPVRPGHQETLENFTRRIQTRNHETAQHRADLVRAYRADHPDVSPTTAWHRLLEIRTSRTLTLQVNVDSTTHADGVECTDCATRIGPRYLCRLCAQGATIEQPAHIDAFVCLHHGLYVGPSTTTRRQSPATVDEISAELLARRLRRKGRLDSALYTTLNDLFTAINPRSASAASDQRATFPALVQVAALVTGTEFRRRFFDPTATYAQSYEYLTSMLTTVPDVDLPALRNRLWLRYRPVFLAVQESLRGGSSYIPNSGHELPGPKSVDHGARRASEVEPFSNYLAVSRNFRIDHRSWSAILTPSTRTMPSWTQSVETICLHGHRTTRTIQGIHKNAKLGKDACGVCHHRIILPGQNDLATTHPRIAASFHPTKNRKTAEEYFAGSAEKVWWLCREGHEWQATCSNRTCAGSGCPLCSFHAIMPGQNDLTTTHPEVARRWDPSNPQELATTSPRSKAAVHWRCTAGHHYKEVISDAADRGTCPVCDREIATLENALLTERPDVAAQLHSERNAHVNVATIAVTSRMELWWECTQGHPFISRVDHRVAGLACTVCFPRKLHRGVNDVQSRYPELSIEWHPYLNGSNTPDRVIPGTNLIWWKCLKSGHNLQQSVPHRSASGGCPDCPGVVRIAAPRSRHA